MGRFVAVKFFMILGLIVLGLGYYFRDDIMSGWTGTDSNARLSMPSAAGSISRSVGGALGGAANRF